MSGGMSMPRSSMMTLSSLATQKLTIQHVQRGCHVWSNGKMTGAMMRLHLRPGQKLSIMDNDVDPHQVMELAGPMAYTLPSRVCAGVRERQRSCRSRSS
jgi:hypothetical protein